MHSNDPHEIAKEDDGEAFDKTTSKGRENGLFQACMKSIRGAHVTSNRLRAGLVLAGLFTDKSIYREVLSMFYVVTKELEEKLDTLKVSDEICQKIASLDYNFSKGYEKDMAVLYGDDWETIIEDLIQKNKVARYYREMVRNMDSGTQLAGAAFVLWGALIIGGGAVAMPRVKNLCGKDAINVFKDVTGPGREERRNNFVALWDSLASPGSSEFEEIITFSQECMRCNNNIFTSLQRSPWWLNYFITAGVGIGAICIVILQRRMIKS